MNRESVKSRIERRRKAQQHQLLIVIAFFSLALGIWLWYHFIYTRTPEYSLKTLKNAIEQHDVDTAARCIDLDMLLSSAYDDLTDDMLHYDSALNDETREKYTAFYNQIKPELVSGMKDTILRYAATGEWILPNGTDITKGRLLGIDFERFLERSQLRSTDLAGAPAVHVTGSHTAVGTVSVQDRFTQYTFTLHFTMQQDSDGHWKITKIKNYRTYLDTISPRQNRDIADYIAATHGIVNEYNEQFAAQRARFQALTAQAKGNLTGPVAVSIKALIQNEVVPTLKERQEQLDAVSIPPGAKYLANQRHMSTDLSIDAWKHYLHAIEKHSNEEFQTAETLLKQAVETDMRIKDIIRHNTVSQSLPDIS